MTSHIAIDKPYCHWARHEAAMNGLNEDGMDVLISGQRLNQQILAQFLTQAQVASNVVYQFFAMPFSSLRKVERCSVRAQPYCPESFASSLTANNSLLILPSFLSACTSSQTCEVGCREHTFWGCKAASGFETSTWGFNIVLETQSWRRSPCRQPSAGK